MPPQTVTRSAECDLDPAAIYNVAADPANLTEWAPLFADAIERIDDAHFTVTKGDQTLNVEVVLHPTAGTVDYMRAMSGGRRGGAFIRVTPRPIGGSSITMTVPVGPNTSDSDVAATVDQELADLIRLTQAPSHKPE